MDRSADLLGLEGETYLVLTLLRGLSSRSYSERGHWAVLGLRFQELGIRLRVSLDSVVVCEEIVSLCN